MRTCQITDEDYPGLLRHIHEAPETLFLRGAPLSLQNPIAVVGTRRMTTYGARAAATIVSDLVRAGCEIISGLAFGIDACAHTSALEARGRTVAVLPSACDDGSIYPREHAVLARRILDEGGTLVSQFPLGTACRVHQFRMRNRVIAGLSRATLVIEAPQKSGALITAYIALDENRDVFAVPGPITSNASIGTNQLLKFGAIPCTSAEDILTHLNIASPQKTPLPTATPNEMALLALLDGPTHIDDVIRARKSPASAILSELTAMELQGLVEHQGGGVYARKISNF